MTAEQWRLIPGFPGYEVSSLGRVWSHRRDQVMVGSPNTDGYLSVPLRRNGRTHTKPIHRLVGEAFLGPLPSGLMTRHLDGDQTNNYVGNLRYGTNAENQRDSVLHGTCRPALATHCPKDHPYNEVNTYLTPSGKRDCRTCRREAATRYRARLAGRVA